MTVRTAADTERGRVAARVLVAGAVAVVALGVLARATLADSSSGAAYRTATVSRSTVVQTLNRSGTIEPAAQATVAFPVSGTVATVGAKVGDAVATGQTLASLDTTSLSGDVAARQAALATARLTLDQAVNGQAASSASGAAGAVASAGRSSTGSSGGSSTGSPGGASRTSSPGQLAPAQQLVLGDQQQVDVDLAAAQAAVATATGACATTAPPVSTTTAVPAITSARRGTTSGTAAGRTPTAPAGTPGEGLGSAACLAAQQQALGSQQRLAASEQALVKAASSLDDLLAAADAATTQSAASSASTPSSASRSASSATGSAPTATQPVVTAAQLVADQAAVDAAASAVDVATQSLDQATIVSPVTGTVAAVNLAPGQQVTAGSGTADVVVMGEGGWEVATTVAVTDVGAVKNGQVATVVPDGTSTPLDGTVVAVGVAPATSGSTTTYPVVVGFSGAPAGLHNGASAAVAIEVARAADALAVPTSAVHSVGTLHVAVVVEKGKTRTVPVRVGTVGAVRTEVTSGLSAGQQVVLADLHQALPASNATNAAGGLGRLGGGGVGGGGIGGGMRIGGGG